MTTTKCPSCGKEMGMTTWIGKKPECYRCSGASFVGDALEIG